MFNIGRIYKNENEAKEAAQITIMEILTNQNYLEDDKFDKMYLQYQEQQGEIEKQIQNKINYQIDALNQSKGIVESCFNNINMTEQLFKELAQEYEKDARFQKELQYYEQMFTYKKNIGMMLDQMKYIFSVQEQIDKMSQEFDSGAQNFDSQFYKLIALVEIRDNIIEAANNTTNNKQDLQIIINEFKCLQNFEGKFYENVFGQLENTLELSIQNPQKLIKMIQIIETGDKVMTTKKQKPVFQERAITVIRNGIDKKFKAKLDDCRDTLEILEKCKFTSADLILVYDHTVKCFPKHYNIFKVFEEQYKINLEQRIMPFLEDEQKIRESFGILILLLAWVYSYENLMQRVGESSDSYVALTCKVKSYMPIFQDHVNGLITNYSQKAIEKDKNEEQTQTNIEQLIKQKREFVTYFPEDIFHFVNQQFELITPKLKGEIVIEFIRSICSTLAELLKKECQQFINELPLSELDSQISPLYLATLYINNYYKCMSHSNETKQYCLQFVEPSLHERTELIFNQDLTQTFNESINLLIEHCVKIILYEVNNQITPQLFTSKWTNEDLVSQALLTIKDYMQEAQVLILNQIHFNKLTKLVFKKFVICYQEQLIFCVQAIQPNIAKNFFPKNLVQLSFVQENEKDKKKKEKERKAQIQMILSNRELVLPQMTKDREQILNIAESEYQIQLGKAYISSIDRSLTTMINGLSKTKGELDKMIPTISQALEGNAIFILEVILWMREDCDQKYKSAKIEQLKNIK